MLSAISALIDARSLDTNALNALNSSVLSLVLIKPIFLLITNNAMLMFLKLDSYDALLISLCTRGISVSSLPI